jgi:betaine-aldehyde dehydrogenase
MTVIEPEVSLSHTDQLFIAGQWVPPSTGDRARVVNPSTEEVIAEVADVAGPDVDAAVEGARSAFDHGPWASLSVPARIAHVRRFTEAVLARSRQIGSTWGAECGPTVGYRDALNGMVAPALFEDAFALAERIEWTEARDGFAGPVEVVREPQGVVVTIITYNGPLPYVGMKVVPALLAGNAVILKVAPETRLVGHLIAEAAAEADLPPGVLSVLVAGAEPSAYLVAHRGVDMVSFTGGTTVGAKILHSTADRIGSVTLELGGKSAGIVAEDMDVAELLPLVLPGLLTFQGQVCVALTRLFVPRHRHDPIVDALVGAFTSISIGDVADPAVDFGPLAVARSRDRCEQYVAAAVREGATVACGGRRPTGLDRGWFYEPTLLVDVHNGMAVAQEEVFGPVFTVIPYEGIDEAVRLANDSDYGLTGAIFTHDAGLARSVGHRLRVGSFTMNSSGGVLGQPFGGYKQSGIGREMGREGLLEYTQTKSMKIDGAANYLA